MESTQDDIPVQDQIDDPVMESETPINAFRTLLPWILLLLGLLFFIWSLRQWT